MSTVVRSFDLDTVRIILQNDLLGENIRCEKMVSIDLSFVSHAEKWRMHFFQNKKVLHSKYCL